MIRRRLVGAYLSTVISISLVLLLVGIACLLLVGGGRVSDYFKENLQLSVLMKQDVSEDSAMRLQRQMDSYPFVRSTRFVSRNQGISEMQELLGEDFLSVFESAPIPVSIDVTLKAEYVSKDSLEVVRAFIGQSDLVDEVSCQESLVEALNANLGKISIFLGVFVALLLFISFVLINNTVRLSVYARRFTIHTMRLVGATRAFIRAPFVARAAFQGLFSALFAEVMLVGLLYLLRSEFAQLFDIFTLPMLLIVLGIIVAAGIVICTVSTVFVVNKLVSLKKGELYY